MDELKNDLENELNKAMAKSKNAYEGMRYIRRRMESQQEEIRVLLRKLGTLLADYQGTCNNFHAAQSQAIKACHDERVIREMLKLAEDL
jgi:hypothetical protein